MGKYYSIKGGDLYVYVTGGDELLDLRLFPAEVGLFGREMGWRASPLIAVSEAADARSLELAEAALLLEGYSPRDVDRASLDSYFLRGDESVLEVEVPAVVSTRGAGEPTSSDAEDG